MRILRVSGLLTVLTLCLVLSIFAVAGCSQQKPQDPTTLPGYDPKVKPAPISQAYAPPYDVKKAQSHIPPNVHIDLSKIVSH